MVLTTYLLRPTTVGHRAGQVADPRGLQSKIAFLSPLPTFSLQLLVKIHLYNHRGGTKH